MGVIKAQVVLSKRDLPAVYEDWKNCQAYWYNCFCHFGDDSSEYVCGFLCWLCSQSHRKWAAWPPGPVQQKGPRTPVGSRAETLGSQVWQLSAAGTPPHLRFWTSPAPSSQVFQSIPVWGGLEKLGTGERTNLVKRMEKSHCLCLLQRSLEAGGCFEWHS